MMFKLHGELWVNAEDVRAIKVDGDRGDFRVLVFCNPTGVKYELHYSCEDDAIAACNSAVAAQVNEIRARRQLATIR